MGQKYEQLSLEQRCTIARYSQAGKTIRKIAAAMDRAPSTIARELKRNRGAKVGYQPVYAKQQAKSRRWRGRKGGSLGDRIESRVAIDRRPAYIHKRRQPGHWEGDLMLFAKYGQAVLVSHERRSRLLVVSRQPNKAADPVATKLTELFRSLPKFLRRTITFDNGTEFSYHYRLHKLSMRTFFCDPHAPWQKGGIENAIGRMRRGLPRKTDLATLSNQRLLSLVRSYNHTPRKCLNYKTPAEVFC